MREAFKGHPVHVHNPDINFATASEVPDSYLWPTLDRLATVGEAVAGRGDQVRPCMSELGGVLSVEPWGGH